jgi:hypothetical protein
MRERSMSVIASVHCPKLNTGNTTKFRANDWNGVGPDGFLGGGGKQVYSMVELRSTKLRLRTLDPT